METNFLKRRWGVDKGVVEQPLPGYVSARTLDLLPHGAQGYSPQVRQALDR